VAQESWITLNDYSNKYRVSISTLRRRIKSSKVEFQLNDGKYFLKNLPLNKHQFVDEVICAAPTSQAQPVQNTAASTAPPAKEAGSQLDHFQIQENPSSPILATANNLLNELKRAYVLILQQKEEQIVELKEESADLKTLVRVLESENDKLNSASPKQEAPIDSWLDSLGADT